MRIEIPLFDGFDDLDAIGPLETLHHAGLDVHLVGAHGPGNVPSSHGATYRVEAGLGRPDALLVPGGGWLSPRGGVRAEVDRGVLPARIAELAPACHWVASVCTGALLLGAAELLRGRPATTHHTAHDVLAERFGADVQRDARYVDDGALLTAAGITAGIDLALHLVTRERGPEAAASVARQMELPYTIPTM